MHSGQSSIDPSFGIYSLQTVDSFVTPRLRWHRWSGSCIFSAHTQRVSPMSSDLVHLAYKPARIEKDPPSP
jgi:hypothetical protein